MPPHVFMLAAVGVGIVAGYRMAYRALKQRDAKPKPSASTRDADEPRDLGALEWDETAGAYRPRHS